MIINKNKIIKILADQLTKDDLNKIKENIYHIKNSMPAFENTKKKKSEKNVKPDLLKLKKIIFSMN